MSQIKFTFNGKPVNNLENAIMKSLSNQLKEKIENRLQPFQSELMANNASVEVIVSEDLENVTYTFTDVPDDLKERIKKALF